MRQLLILLAVTALVGCGRTQPLDYGPPKLTLTPKNLDLGQALPGSRLQGRFTANNTGRVPVTLTRVSTTQSDELAFSVVTDTLPVTIAPGGFANIVVTFQANLPPGPRTATVSAASDAPLATGTVTAITLDPCTPENCGPSNDVCLGDGRCVEGRCVRDPKTGTACNDDNLCTLNDVCTADGKCSGTALACNTPPPTVCLSPDTLATYLKGTCAAGVCSYPPTTERCPFGCVDNKCFDPCATVVCNTPPTGCHKPIGVCKPQLPIGVCSYELDDGKSCNDGDPCTVTDTCLSAVCKGSPMVCNSPPAGSCIDEDNAKTFDPMGQCVMGSCQYTSQQNFCPIACLRGACMASCTVGLVAGNGSNGFTDGPAFNARFADPYTLVVDSAGTLTVEDTGNGRIRQISNGIVSTLFSGTSQGHDVAFDGTAGNGFIIGSAGRISKLSTSGVLTQLAGTGIGGLAVDGPAATAGFGNEVSVLGSSAGAIYIADADNHRVRKLQNGMVTTLAGTGIPGKVDGPNALAQYNHPHDLIFYKGEIYIADASSNALRKLSEATGQTTTIAGTGASGTINSSPLASRFDTPLDVAVDPEGAFYLADTGNNCIRRVSKTRVTTFAGVCGPVGSYIEGPAQTARFRGPVGLTVSGDGTFFIADTSNNRIRRIDCRPGDPFP